MLNPKNIHIADYHYDLPDERIAKFPLAERDASKLLVFRHGEVSEDVFTSLPKYLPQGALMVFNNTKVIQARLHFRKTPTDGMQGALIEVFCLEPAVPNDYQLNFSQKGSVQWYCLVGNLKKWKEGPLFREIEMPDGEKVTLACERKGLHGTSHIIEFTWDGNYTWAELLDAVGELPIPPYLNRATQESDKTTYQTVYSKIKGSVAAPTAGLHFTERVLQALDAAGIDREELTLHVGAGTFKPVKSEEIGDHDMHTEHIAVRRQTIEKLIATEVKPSLSAPPVSAPSKVSITWVFLPLKERKTSMCPSGCHTRLSTPNPLRSPPSVPFSPTWTSITWTCSTPPHKSSLPLATNTI